jgi:pyruvate kinase
LEWGAVSGVVEQVESVEEMIERAMDAARRLGGLDDGSQVVLTYGPAVDRPGATNMIVARTIGG